MTETFTDLIKFIQSRPGPRDALDALAELCIERGETIEQQRVEIERLKAACRAMIAWDDAEKTGPDYGSQTRDTHPDGERIWRRWWDDQCELCARAFNLARAALTEGETNNG